MPWFHWPPAWWPFRPTPAPPSAVPFTARDVFDALNRVRARSALPAYGWDASLAAVAQAGADFSVAVGRLTHGNWPARIATVHALSAGEDIEEGALTADQVVTEWLGDLAHRVNVMSGSFNHAGVGIQHDGRGTVYVFADFDQP